MGFVFIDLVFIYEFHEITFFLKFQNLYLQWYKKAKAKYLHLKSLDVLMESLSYLNLLLMCSWTYLLHLPKYKSIE